MTTRFFKAAGTLAVALVLLAGCDSAVDSGGLAPTADLVGAIQGPSPIAWNCPTRYTLYTAGRPGDWTIDEGATFTEGFDAAAQAEFIDATFPSTGTYTITWTSGSMVVTKTVTVSSVLACAVATDN